jgi:beta-lactamase regulating signal transducer with metallopeptidase domain
VAVESAILGFAAWLLTYALHSTVLIGGAWLVAVALARLACRKGASGGLRDMLPSLRERLWKIALVGGVLTASLQVGLGLDPWKLELALSEGVTQPLVQRQLDQLALVPRAPSHATLRTLELGTATEAPTTEAPTTNLMLPPSFDARPAPTARVPGWLYFFAGLWLLGVAFGVMRWICQWNRLLRNLDDREPITAGPSFELFQALRARSSSRLYVRLSSAPSISTPITLGLLRPEICLPPRAERELDADEVSALLAHELAHAERRDPTWLAICKALEVLFFFQPLNRACARWLQDEAEYLCDDRAVVLVGERVPLAACLTEIAGWMVHEPVPELVAGMAAHGQRLALRVNRLLDDEHAPERSGRGAWMSACATVFACAVACFAPGVAARASGVGAETFADTNAPTFTYTPRALEDAVTGLEQRVLFAADSVLDAPAPPPPSEPPTPQPDDASDVAEPNVQMANELQQLLEQLGDELTALREQMQDHAVDCDFKQRFSALEASFTSLDERRRTLETHLMKLEVSP